MSSFPASVDFSLLEILKWVPSQTTLTRTYQRWASQSGDRDGHCVHIPRKNSQPSEDGPLRILPDQPLTTTLVGSIPHYSWRMDTPENHLGGLKSLQISTRYDDNTSADVGTQRLTDYERRERRRQKGDGQEVDEPKDGEGAKLGSELQSERSIGLPGEEM